MEAEEDALQHIGIKRRSGRYPWGSGDTPYQRSLGFKQYIDPLLAQGMTHAQIAEGLGIKFPGKPGERDPKSTDVRAGIALATEEIRAENQTRATNLKSTGMSTSAIAREMGTNESTVRGWLKRSEDYKAATIKSATEHLKGQLEEKPFLDVGKGTNLYMGISDVKLKTALAALRDEGYNIWSVKLPQAGTDKLTTYKVLTHPEVPWSEAAKAVREGRLKIVTTQSDDGGLTFKTPKSQPVSVDSKRIEVKWGDEGGKAKDGVIELRRGVEDLSLGKANYAQVRIAVDGTHYLKGMAMYADDLPHGVDMRFNTNKTKAEAGGDKLGAMKPMKRLSDGKIDPDSPFGAQTLPKMYTDKHGKEQTSPLNIVNEEGKWSTWSNALSSQMLSKQSISLASAQLGQARTKQQRELDDLSKLTNPVVKKKLLDEYADNADAAAVHLKAAAFDRQGNHVILPISSMRPNEIYARNFTDGEKVVLVRHPHGGPFEIPELTVNNRNAEARRILKGAEDAVGIHHSVAAQLSGADFDGDTVLVIPNNRRLIKSDKPWKDLQNFDPKEVYKIPEGDTAIKRMTKKNTQTEMGKISNLITDMSIHRANQDELIRAVKHSMVVIDAEKHGLNYKQSEKDHGIAQLKTKYQGGPTKGASTLISRAGSEIRVPQFKQLSGAKGVNPRTGAKVTVPTGAMRRVPIRDRQGNPTGQYELIPVTTKVTRMEIAKDARDLLSSKTKPQPMEEVYAEHANAMKGLANEARKQSVGIKLPKQSAAAKALYAHEVASLDAKLKVAQRNAPLERRAQSIANAAWRAKLEANPGMDKDEIKKAKFAALEDARNLTGASKKRIGTEDNPLTDREWEAIQSGAVSSTKLAEILSHAHMERVRELATPRPRSSLTSGQIARAKSLKAAGRSVTEIAAQLGLPRSTVADNLKS